MAMSGNWKWIGALALFAGGAYFAATAANPTTQKLGLLGSGIGAGMVVVHYL